MAKDLATLDTAAYDAAVKAITEGTEVDIPVGDPEAVSRAIVERVLAAESFEDAFAPQEIPSWRSLMDVPVLVRSVHLNRSTFDAGSPIYAVCDLMIADSGEITTVTCGGRNVLAQLLTMLKNGWQNHPVRLTAKTTGEGYSVLWLQAA